MKLPDISCECGRTLSSREFEPNGRRGAPRASGYASCLRKCELCGVGYSNASTSDRTKLQRILRAPFEGLPAWLNDGLDDALNRCLNQASDHARKKREAFQSVASEDHATWTVMRALQRVGALGKAFGRENSNPAMLLWGVPVPASDAGDALRERLLYLLRNNLGEREGWFTEPDVILDFGSSIIFVEAKLTSSNDAKAAGYGGWRTYVDSNAFASPELAVKSKLYQLARNWRIAVELADARHFTVVNLAPSFSKAERRSLAMLRASTNRQRAGTVTLRTWDKVSNALKGEDWFERYAQARGLWQSQQSYTSCSAV